MFPYRDMRSVCPYGDTGQGYPATRTLRPAPEQAHQLRRATRGHGTSHVQIHGEPHNLGQRSAPPLALDRGGEQTRTSREYPGQSMSIGPV